MASTIRRGQRADSPAGVLHGLVRVDSRSRDPTMAFSAAAGDDVRGVAGWRIVLFP
jgi:hypothetical protein